MSALGVPIGIDARKFARDVEQISLVALRGHDARRPQRVAAALSGYLLLALALRGRLLAQRRTGRSLAGLGRAVVAQGFRSGLGRLG